jgi:hypothetical protein
MSASARRQLTKEPRSASTDQTQTICVFKDRWHNRAGTLARPVFFRENFWSRQHTPNVWTAEAVSTLAGLWSGNRI